MVATEFLAAEQCAKDARSASSIAAYFEETFTATPHAWLREVLLMTSELLTGEEFEQVANYYLDADDGSGATSVRVDQMVSSHGKLPLLVLHGPVLTDCFFVGAAREPQGGPGERCG